MNSNWQKQIADSVKGEGERQQAKEVPGWWVGASEGERRLIQAVMWLLGSAKHSPEKEVAWAGRKWGPAIGCFIKTRLIAEIGRTERRRQKWKRRVTQSDSAGAAGRSAENLKEA
jgi:hypothetical protein